MGEYSGILGRQNQQLGGIKGNLLQKIRNEMKELELARQGLEAEMEVLKTERMAGVRG